MTWNNFGSSYDPAVAGQFVTDVIGWHTIDLTALVQAWVDGTYPNYGVYLEQDTGLFSTYHSSEYAADISLRPKLEICYQAGTGTACATMQRPGDVQNGVADADIFQLFPNDNGNSETLFTGIVSDNQKQTLIRFGLATLGDFVWLDNNNKNGLQDSGEPGVGNVPVNLYKCGSPMTLLASTSTITPTGLYKFAGLVPGCYVIEFVKPFGDSFTILKAGGGTNPLIDSNANLITGLTDQINLAAEQIDLSWDAGLISPPTAVTLSTFDARTSSNSITLNWKTASEVNHAGFNVYRSDRADGPYVRINTQLIPASFNTLTGGTYQYIDVNVVPGQTYYYQLEDVELNGTSARHKPIAVTLDSQAGWSSSMLVFGGLGIGVVALACAGLIILRKRA